MEDPEQKKSMDQLDHMEGDCGRDLFGMPQAVFPDTFDGDSNYNINIMYKAMEGD